jgi:hypothetical protein
MRRFGNHGQELRNCILTRRPSRRDEVKVKKRTNVILADRNFGSVPASFLQPGVLRQE